MATAIANSLTDHSPLDGTNDAINGAEVDANPMAIAQILDGTTATDLGGAGTVDILSLRVLDLGNAAGAVQTNLVLEWDPADGGQMTDNSSGVGIDFKMPDDGDTQDIFGSINVMCLDDAAGGEDGEMSFKVMKNGTNTEILTLSATSGVTFGVDDTGYDFLLYGASAGAFSLWDSSADTHIIRGATAAGPGKLNLSTGELTVVDGDILGRIDFQAPLEASGTDAILVGASIWAEADDTFGTALNDTDLVFAVAESETAAERMRLSYDGTTVGLTFPGVTTISTAAGALNLTPAAGSAIVLDGTISVDAGVVTGATSITSTAFVGDITGDVTGNVSGSAGVATTVSITDNESTNETNAIIFTAGGDVDGGNLGLESDGNLTYNPSSGLLSSTTLTTTGVVTAGGVTLADSAPITMGTGSDATLQFNATNTVLATAGALILQINGTTEAMRIDSAGLVTIGATANSTGDLFEINKVNSNADIGLRRVDSSISGTDTIGQINWYGDDPSAPGGGDAAGRIKVIADGTWGANDFPAAMVFMTDQGGTITEAMRIDSEGHVQVGGVQTTNFAEHMITISEDKDGGDTAIQIYNSDDSTNSTDETASIWLHPGPTSGKTGISAYRATAPSTTANRDYGLKFYVSDSNSQALAMTIEPELQGVQTTGSVYIGDTANANMSLGLTINQGANDNEIIALKSSDAGHPMTAQAEADTYGFFQKVTNDGGGLRIQGLSNSGLEIGLQLLGMCGNATGNTAKSTTGTGIVQFNTYVTNGSTNVQAPGSNENLVGFASAGTTRFLFDTEGSAHADVEWTTYDEHDDLGLIRTMEEELLGVENPAKTQRRHRLEEVGIIGENSWHFENGKQRAMVNHTKLQMLHHGALMQVADRFDDIQSALDAKDSRITALESQLKRLEMK